MSEKQHSCLIANNAQIPLEGVRIEARVSGLCSEVTVTQRYMNTEKVDVEAVYVFPLEEGAAVCGFTARVGDRLIRGRVEGREKAFEIYDDAMAAGHGAFLLDQERPNIFTASVGNLKSGQTVEISITYVALLNFEGASIRLMIPTTVSPRYVPAGPPEVGEPDSERVNPPARDAVPYGLSLTVNIAADSKIAQLESPSHTISTSFEQNGATVELSTDQTALDRDFVLLVKPQDAHKPVARVAREADGTLVAMVTFHPDPSGMSNPGNEVLFLLDCSGSMQGDSIDQARRALALCLRALSENDTFNIVRFGSSFTSLWNTAQPYNQSNLDAATRYVQSIQADLGGTEILAPLKHLLELPADAKRARQVLLLTDGEVGNEADVIELCKKHAATARVFTFGIGAGASEHLVRNVARVSRGAAEFIYPGERIEPKVLRMFGRVNTPAVKSVAVDWRGLDVEQAPAECPPVFGGDSLTVFGRVKSGSADRVVLSADERSWEIPLDLGQAEEAGPIPTLWARQRIRDLEAGHGAPARGSNQARRSKEDRTHVLLVELGERYGLMSSATSYVAVEERSEADKTKTQAELRKVPIAITRGWHGRGTVLHKAMPAPAMRAMSTGLQHALAMAPPPPAGAVPESTGAFMDLAGEEPMPAEFQEERVQMARSGSVLGRLFGGRHERAKKKAPAARPRVTGARQVDPKELDQAVLDALDSAGDRLFDLLMTQQADGSFRLSEALLRWLGSRAAKVEAAAAKQGEALVATAVALELLRTEAADRADEWKPAAAKAERWLAGQGRPVEVAELLKP
jgi:Ca-activated chloride channel family protein